MNSTRNILSKLRRNYLLGNKMGLFLTKSHLRGNKWHVGFILHLVEVCKPNTYLEIGLHEAALFNLVSKRIRTCVGVDVNPKVLNFVNTKANSQVCIMHSTDFWESYDGPKFDMIFVDGNHSKEQVEIDFHGALRFLTETGILLIHDTYPLDLEATSPQRCDDGYLAIDKLNREFRDFVMVTIPLHPGLTLVRKRTKQVPWDLSS